MNNLFTSLSKIAKRSLKTAFLLFTLLFSQILIGQTNFYATVGQSHLNCTRGADACPANDLQVKDVYIGNIGECLTCNTGGQVTADLYMVIDNTTGSVRTSFALFGTLSSGASINGFSGNIFICVGEITVLKGLNTFKVGQITFTCGQQLTLTNNYLAYTPASGTTEEVCTKLSQATTCQDIRPKCGVSASITIRTPVTATASTATQPCIGSTTGGSIKVTPSGGVAPYAIDIFKKGTGDCPATAPAKTDASYVTSLTVSTSGGNATTSTNLAPGTYCIYVNDSKQCKTKISWTVDGKPCCENPAKPTICQVRPSACGTETKVILKVSSLTANSDYHVKQGGTEITGSPKASSTATNGVLTFTLTPGGGTLSVYGTQTVDGSTCTGTAATCADLNECSQTAARTTEVQTQEIKLPGAQTKVKAMPNPFNDRIKFALESAVSGEGSLDLYNMLGQKVKNVYQGYIEKGRVQSIEYSVPGAQRANLIYIFRVGNQKATGKLVQLK